MHVRMIPNPNKWNKFAEVATHQPEYNNDNVSGTICWILDTWNFPWRQCCWLSFALCLRWPNLWIGPRYGLCYQGRDCRGRCCWPAGSTFPIQDRKYLFTSFNVDEWKRYQSAEVKSARYENSCNNYYDSFSCISYSSHLVCKKKLRLTFSTRSWGSGILCFFSSLGKSVSPLVLHHKRRNHFAHRSTFLYVLYGIAMATIFKKKQLLVFFKWLREERNLEKIQMP